MVILLTSLQQDEWKNYWCADENGERWYFKRSNGIRALHEWLAAEIGKRMDLPVPEVRAAQMEGTLGVAIKDVGPGINDESKGFYELVKTMRVNWELLATVAAFDILVCNMDRDGCNWFLQQQQNGQTTFCLLDHDDAFLGRALYLNVKERDRQAQISRCYSGYPMRFREMATRWRESPMLSKALQTDWEGELSEPCANFMSQFPRFFPALRRRIFQLLRLRQARMSNNFHGDELGRKPRSSFDIPIKSRVRRLW